MKFLLDTHVLLWYLLGNSNLSDEAKVEDTQTYLNLPLQANHRDPFDRILVAQAINRSLVLVSQDSKFDGYAIQRSWRSS